VNEGSAAEAVKLARENPKLGVGLHLSLLCGCSALPHFEIPELVDKAGNFATEPAATGFRYFFKGSLTEQLRREIQAQFERFKQTGLTLDHVNGHLHMHLHPVVFGLVMEMVDQYGVQRVRLTNDLFWLNAHLAGGQWVYRASHAVVYRVLSAWARPKLVQRGIRFTPRVFGLLQNARVDEGYVLKLLPALPPGDSELYSHPSLDEFRNEFEALTSPSVSEMVKKCGIQLIRYQDL